MFRDRTDAGETLARRVAALGLDRPIIYGLPRGGVEVAAPVADRLGAPLDVLLVAKVRAPMHPELAIGAVGEDGVTIIDREILARAGISQTYLDRECADRRSLLERRAVLYRGDRPPTDPRGRAAVIVDDGIATGKTALAAVQVLRARLATWIVLATPVAPPQTLGLLVDPVDQIVCLLAPPDLGAVGQAYEYFGQTQDDRVVELLSPRR